MYKQYTAITLSNQDNFISIKPFRRACCSGWRRRATARYDHFLFSDPTSRLQTRSITKPEFHVFISRGILGIHRNDERAHTHFFREQGLTIGVDIIGEDKMDSLAAAMKAEETKGRGDTEIDVKFEGEDSETPEWERDTSIGTELPNNVTENRLVRFCIS